MGGPFRAIVGGQARYKWSFAPAAWVRVDNNSTQYFRLDELDDYVVPGQINKFISVDGLTSLTGIFSAPPGASQAAPTAGQIAQVWTYEVGAPGGPLGPSPGLLLPIGLDQPQHFHNHSHGPHSHSHGHGTHNHAHSATHSHSHAHGLHAHGHSATHIHNLNIQAGGAIVTAIGFDAGGNLVAAAGPNPLVPTTAAAPGSTDNASIAADATASSPGNTDLASVSTDATPTTPAADTTLENVQHTHP